MKSSRSLSFVNCYRRCVVGFYTEGAAGAVGAPVPRAPSSREASSSAHVPAVCRHAAGPVQRSARWKLGIHFP